MKLLRFFRRVLISRLALALVFLNLILCIYAFVDRPPENIDIRYESWLFIILTILNLPSIFFSLIPWFLFAAIYSFLGYSDPPNKFVKDGVPILIMLICASFQWALIGYGIDKLLQRRKKMKHNRLM